MKPTEIIPNQFQVAGKNGIGTMLSASLMLLTFAALATTVVANYINYKKHREENKRVDELEKKIDKLLCEKK